VVRNTLALLTPHTGSLLADQQDKRSGTYQQRNQNTNDERGNPTPTLDGLRSSTLLHHSDA
jgi:hypothetical protein